MARWTNHDDVLFRHVSIARIGVLLDYLAIKWWFDGTQFHTPDAVLLPWIGRGARLPKRSEAAELGKPILIVEPLHLPRYEFPAVTPASENVLGMQMPGVAIETFEHARAVANRAFRRCPSRRILRR